MPRLRCEILKKVISRNQRILQGAEKSHTGYGATAGLDVLAKRGVLFVFRIGSRLSVTQPFNNRTSRNFKLCTKFTGIMCDL